jgi:hypothetical protein|tara:strand:+ start:2302 stop:2514 length:213 start_codon:yes stop_codon:yes gene_type:complete
MNLSAGDLFISRVRDKYAFGLLLEKIGEEWLIEITVHNNGRTDVRRLRANEKTIRNNWVNEYGYEYVAAS